MWQGLLDTILKDINLDFFKAIKYSIRHLHIQTHQKTPVEMCQIFSVLTMNTPVQRLFLLLLTLNIFHTLFYCYCY